MWELCASGFPNVVDSESESLGYCPWGRDQQCLIAKEFLVHVRMYGVHTKYTTHIWVLDLARAFWWQGKSTCNCSVIGKMAVRES
jgi:hypothetical protein